MKDLFEVLHIVSAVFLIGPLAILPMTALRALRDGQGTLVRYLARTTAIVAWLSLLVAVFGFGLMAFEEDLTFTTPWFLASIILYSLAITIALSFVVPLLTKAAGQLGDGKLAMDYRTTAVLSGLTTLLLIVVAVLMVWRPGS